MKKIIQVCSMLCLVFVLSAVSAKAQVATKRYAAQIPFDFSIGQKSYQAGSYVIRVSKLSLDSVSLALEDKDRKVLKTIIVRGNGDLAKTEEKLVFTRNGEQRILSRLVTQENGFTIPSSNESKRALLKAQGKPEVKTEVVTIASN